MAAKIERATVRQSLGALAADERDALARRAGEYGVELSPEATVFVTDSAIGRSVLGLRRSPKQVRTVLCVTPEVLLIAVAHDDSLSVLHARPEALRLSGPRFADNPQLAGRLADRLAELIADGIDLTGFGTHVDGVATEATYHLGLAAPDGDEARAVVARHVSATR